MKYGTFLYGTAEQYGATTDDRLHWAVEVDWDDDSIFDGSNEAERLMHLTVERGRDQFVDYTGNSLQFPTVGRAVLTMDNHDQRYNAWYTDGPLYGYIEPGKYARLWVRNGSSSDNDYFLMSGLVTDITPIGKLNEQTEIVIEDGLQWLEDNEAYKAVYTSIRVDEAIGYVLDGVSWPSIWGEDLDVSPYYVNYWWSSGKAGDQIKDLMQTGLGYFCQAADGKARYINRSTATTDAVALTDANTLDNVQLSQLWANYKNIVNANYSPVIPTDSTEITLWSSTDSLPIGAAGDTNDHIEYIAGYTYENKNVSATNVNARIHMNGVFTISVAGSIDYGASIKLVITNLTETSGVITGVEVYGRAIVPQDTAKVQATATGYTTKPRTFTLNLPWSQNYSDAYDIAHIMADTLSEKKPYPVLQVEARPDIQFKPDLFDTIGYTSSKLGISDTYRVGKITHEWLSETGQAVRTTFKLEPYIAEPVGLWMFDVSSFGSSDDGGTVFG